MFSDSLQRTAISQSLNPSSAINFATAAGCRGSGGGRPAGLGWGAIGERSCRAFSPLPVSDRSCERDFYGERKSHPIQAQNSLMNVALSPPTCNRILR